VEEKQEGGKLIRLNPVRDKLMRMTDGKKSLIVLGAALVVAASTPLLIRFAIDPFKFQRVIKQIESAATAGEERAAFKNALRAGYVWEVNRLLDGQRPDRAAKLQGESVYEIEWLECSPWTKEPYRAYRSVIDSSNLLMLYATQAAPRLNL
jgi:hypothetical protein